MAASPELQLLAHPPPELEKVTLRGPQVTNGSLQILPSTILDPPTTRTQYDVLIKGFSAITVAGAFVASIQAQVMSTTLSANPENGAIRAINTLYLGGLVLDILSALLAFLTTRWLERLAEREKDLVEIKFSYQNLNADEKVLITPRPMRPWKTRDRQWCYYTWLSLSLFVPLPLLIFGVMCMIVGICTYAWTQQPVVVGSLVTLASVVPLLFIVGDFSIGRERDKREKLITRLSEMQGNW